MGSRGLFVFAALVLASCGDNFHPGGGALLVTPQTNLRTTEAGGTATFTVALTNAPYGSVQIEIASTNPDEGTVWPQTLTFRETNYTTPQTVTITGVDDDIADGDVAYSIEVSAPRMQTFVLDVINADDDTAGVTVTPIAGLMTTEGGGTAEFTVVLTARPAADVTIPLSSSDPSEGLPDVSSLTFTPDNWNVEQTVTVTGQQDLIADGMVAYTIVLGPATSTDPAYDGLDPDDVSLVNIDDDVAGIAVVAPAILATSETGTQDSFVVVLQTEPVADVTIDVRSSDTSEATVSPAQLVFTPANWNVPQTVTVTGEDDFVVDGDQPFTIELGPAVSADPVYADLGADDIPGVNSDDDVAGIVVTPTSGLVTTEGGGTDTFTVVLTSEPTSDVSIALSSSNPAEGTVSPTTLTFTAANWDQPQTVTVTGVDDTVNDGDQAYTIVLAPATSADPVYAGIDPDDVSVTNLNDDLARIIVTPTSGLVVSEDGTTDTFTIVLDTAPTANVTINLTSSDPTEGTVSPSSVMFTPTNWSTPRTITVRGVDDAIIDGHQVFQIITSPATSADPAYNGLDPDDVEVTNFNNDHADVIVVSLPILFVSEDGTTATFLVRLSNPPTSTVTCPVRSSDPSEGAVSPTTLTFTPSSYGFRTVTVTGVDDSLRDGPVLFSVLLDPCTSADPQYDGANPSDVLVINFDND